MNTSLASFPQSFDVLHLILVGATLFFVLLWLRSLLVKPKAVAPIDERDPSDEPTVPSGKLQANSSSSALQLLSLLQQQARFVDFVSEDIQAISDADVGAVARVVHEGGRKVLAEHFTVDPVRSEAEDSQVTVPAGFESSETRLTGNVVGSAPFNGTLVHRGWRVSDVRLPMVSAGHNARVIAPCEVEL